MDKQKPSFVRVTLFRSPIGQNKRQRKTLETLGLKRINQSVEHKDCDSLRGMIDRVSHLIHVEELE
ncbi:MAG: 50S ribosomal protein L30 [Chloroflexota bacterium]|nr:50S ribosomal protein L30 [Chloroflexota bacterium]